MVFAACDADELAVLLPFFSCSPGRGEVSDAQSLTVAFVS
jgi:hypothetical protein